MKFKNDMLPKYCCILIILAFLAGTGCAGRPAPPPVSEPIPPAAQRYDKLVAVAGFENRSTYSADKLWDTSSSLLNTRLIQMGVFRVVEWERMKQLFDWDLLSTAALVQSPAARGEAQRILLCEYFMGGAVTFFNVGRSGRASAISKSKSYTTTIRVDLWLQDAQTGEYLTASSGQGEVERVFRGGLAGGQTGAWDPHDADQALSQAISEALDALVANYARNMAGR